MSDIDVKLKHVSHSLYRISFRISRISMRKTSRVIRYSFSTRSVHQWREEFHDDRNGWKDTNYLIYTVYCL